MLCNDVIGGLILYTMPPCRSSKIFATRVFWRLRNHTFDGHISGLDQDRDNLKKLLPTSRLRPVDWYQCRVCHVTILLPVWRFWPFGVIKIVGNGGYGDFAGRGSCHKLSQRGPRTGAHGVARVDSDHAECGGVSNRIKDSVL